jgi:hypothetical protein
MHTLAAIVFLIVCLTLNLRIHPTKPTQSHEVRAAATATLSVLGFLFASDDIAFLRFFHTLLCRLTLEVDDSAGADSGAMLRGCSVKNEPPKLCSHHRICFHKNAKTFRLSATVFLSVEILFLNHPIIFAARPRH